jgi:hypothetical protein
MGFGLRKMTACINNEPTMKEKRAGCFPELKLKRAQRIMGSSRSHHELRME